jgi:hypothetical protein
MPEPDLIQLFAEPLNQLGARYIGDIRSMIAISGDQLDRPALREWIQSRGLQDQWRLVSD